MIRDARPFCSSSRGFTLVELLVVLGILMLLLGLSIGAVMRTPRVNALVGTEQLVADVVRQARHTARSSGAPVVIEILKDDRQVMGVSQIPLWTDTFEDGGAWGSYSAPIGLSGKGVTLFPSAVPPQNTYPPPVKLDAQHRLARPGSGSRVSEGFYLSCAVRPPAAKGGQDFIPLILVGDYDPADLASGETESAAACGLMLARTDRTIQAAQNRSDVTTPFASSPQFSCWELRGWVNSAAGAGFKVASLAIPDAVFPDGSGLTPDNLDTTTSTDKDVTAPIAGDAWEEFGLLYDGQRLELYRNGQIVASVAADAGALKMPDHDPGVHLGHVHLNVTPTTGGTERIFPLSCVIDDARLYRLGVDRAGTLPSGVSPSLDYRITAHPDGRCEVSQYNPQPPGWATTNSLLFTLPNAGATDSAQVTVPADGQVTSAVVTP